MHQGGRRRGLCGSRWQEWELMASGYPEQELVALMIAGIGACLAHDSRNISSWDSVCQVQEFMQLRVVGLSELTGFKVAGMEACAAQYGRSWSLQPSGCHEQELVQLGWQDTTLSGKQGGCLQSWGHFQHLKKKIIDSGFLWGKVQCACPTFTPGNLSLSIEKKYDLLKASFGCLQNVLLNLQHHVYRDTAVPTCYSLGFLCFSMLLNQLPSLIEQRCRDTRALMDWSPSCQGEKKALLLSQLSSPPGFQK